MLFQRFEALIDVFKATPDVEPPRPYCRSTPTTCARSGR